MARDTPIPIQLGQYVAARTLATLFQCFDIDQNLETANVVGTVFYRTNARRRARAETNISLCFPDWTPEHVARVAERSMQYMFQMFMVDSMAVPRVITATSWPNHVRLGHIGPMLERMIQGKPLIMITGHCGNWELLGHILALFGYPVLALARPLDNQYLDRWFMGIREATGTRILTKWGATPVVEKTLEDGGRVGFIADQNAGDNGLFVPFFGRLASSYKSIALLAMRHEVPIAAGSALRVNGRLQYELNCVDYIAPEDWVDQPDPLFYITARFNRAMETMIRGAPEQYLWVHRRWRSRPRHEREGKPMPSRLIRKIEELPWMTQAERDSIVNFGVTPEPAPA